jgi:hypothetical protein
MDDIIEQWKDIEGYEGFYQISDLGNIKSVSRFVNNKHNTLSFIKEKKMNPSIDRDGYYYLNLMKNGIRKRFTVHNLVSKTFLGKKTDESLVIDHINNIKNDNRVCNLQYISLRENVSKDRKNKNNFLGIYKNGTKFSAKIVINGVRKYLGSFNTPEEANNEYIKNLNLIKN